MKKINTSKSNSNQDSTHQTKMSLKSIDSIRYLKDLLPKKEFRSFVEKRTTIQPQKFSPNKYSFKKKNLNKSLNKEIKNDTEGEPDDLFIKGELDGNSDDVDDELFDKQNKINSYSNSVIINNYKNRVNELMQNNSSLSSQLKNLNNELRNKKSNELNLQNDNNDLKQENSMLKNSLAIMKSNYEKEFSNVTNSLNSLNEKYQAIKKELEKNNIGDN